LYKGLIEKGAILFYLMTKNHPFENGNKRIAVMTLLLFLYKNEKWLDIGNQQIYRIALGVAKSKPKSKDLIISWIKNELKEHLINYPKN
jgi:death-on-curing protein